MLPIASDTLIVEDEDTGVEWKIVQSAEYEGEGLGYWQQDVWPSADSYFPDHINDTDVSCLSELGCLFNLSEDPLERHDLGLVEPDKLNDLSNMLADYVKGSFQTGDDGYEDPGFLSCVSLEEKIAETGGWAAPVCT